MPRLSEETSRKPFLVLVVERQQDGLVVPPRKRGPHVVDPHEHQQKHLGAIDLLPPLEDGRFAVELGQAARPREVRRIVGLCGMSTLFQSFDRLQEASNEPRLAVREVPSLNEPVHLLTINRLS